MKKIKREILRKTLHLFGITVWLIYEYLGYEYTLIYLIGGLFVSFALELIRLKKYSIHFFKKIIEKIAREQEKQKFAAHVYFFAGATLTMYLLKNMLAVIAIMVFISSDAIAAIVGMTIGRHKNPFNKDKTIEGTLAGTIVAFIITYLFLGEIYAVSAASIFFIADSIDMVISDNLTLPLFIGITLRIINIIVS